MTKILSSARENSHLFEPVYIPETLYLLSTEICAQDNESRNWGITKNQKGEIVFCSEESKDSNSRAQISVGKLIDTLWDYHVPIKELKSRFLEGIQGPLRKYEETKAEINIKVHEKIRKLERALLD